MEKENGMADEVIEALKETFCYKGDVLLTYLYSLEYLYELSKDEKYSDEYVKSCDLYNVCPNCKGVLSYHKEKEPFGECRGNKCYRTYVIKKCEKCGWTDED